ncbi:cold-shock protein [Alteriqipengyuania sp. WL0013]|uniref:cold-shock protein n=1 Tax=Alteriqipengyuania sp. WL0013 TaxID=3110773 RepID=UPI002CC91EE5|nr:cold-shock protein [Alteriqipengyuania sp. WL0013]MEB3416640.1 cold-shock protein [Alteriqipengyuania sp. WL0013]
MAHTGKIKSYDSNKGVGTIAPEKGGDALPFKKSDLQQEAQEPKVDQSYEFETSEVDGGSKRAVNLQQQQGDGSSHKDQARKQQG